MVIDLKQIRLKENIGDGALWVVEQIPGLVVGRDQTPVLRAGQYSMLIHIDVAIGKLREDVLNGSSGPQTLLRCWKSLSVCFRRAQVSI